MAWIGAAWWKASASAIRGSGPEVPAGEQASAERAGDQDRVARPGARAADGAARGRLARARSR